MAVSKGDAVEIAESGVSVKGGTRRATPAGLVGRVCKKYPSGFCCIQFQGLGCFRMHQHRLQRTDQPAPECSRECEEGC